jgi:hypothetical protein
VLFTTEDISLREANEVLQQAGFSGLMRLDEVRRVDKIPVGGTGKPDWKLLRSQLLKQEGKEASGAQGGRVGHGGDYAVAP